MSVEFDEIHKTVPEFSFNAYSAATVKSLYNEFSLKEQNEPLGIFALVLWERLREDRDIKISQIDSGNEEKEPKFTFDIFPNSSDNIDLPEKDLKKILTKIFGDNKTCQKIIKTIKERKKVVLSKI